VVCKQTRSSLQCVPRAVWYHKVQMEAIAAALYERDVPACMCSSAGSRLLLDGQLTAVSSGMPCCWCCVPPPADMSQFYARLKGGVRGGAAAGKQAQAAVVLARDLLSRQHLV
jgi:hypothetical protein